MKILGFETSCEHATVALAIDGEIIQCALEGHANHSEKLLPSVQAMLAEAGIVLGDLDAIAFGSGPGAFTGLRLSCGVAQGLAMGADLGVAPISSLEVLSQKGEGTWIAVATDARMGEVYCALYQMVGGYPRALDEPVCVPPQQMTLPDRTLWYGVGSAFRVHAAAFASSLTERLVAFDADAVPTAAGVLRLAAVRIAEGSLVAPELAAPIYVRNKVALTTAERRSRGGRS